MLLLPFGLVTGEQWIYHLNPLDSPTTRLNDLVSMGPKQDRDHWLMRVPEEKSMTSFSFLMEQDNLLKCTCGWRSGWLWPLSTLGKYIMGEDNIISWKWQKSNIGWHAIIRTFDSILFLQYKSSSNSFHLPLMRLDNYVYIGSNNSSNNFCWIMLPYL